MDLSPKRASTSALVLFLVANIVLLTFVNYGYTLGWFGWLEAPTNDLIQATLLGSLLVGLVVVGCVVFAYARLTPADVGLGWRQLRSGVLYTLILWALTQAINGLADVITTGGLQLNTNWPEAGAAFIIGALLAQVCGNALIEEIGWRGFLLPQVFWRLGGNDGPTPRQNLVLAVLGVQFLFALIHIPNRLLVDNMLILELVASLVYVFIVGIFFAWIYLRTGNLFLAIGVHALFNTPTVLFASVLPSQAILGALTILMLVVWPQITIHRMPRLGTRAAVGAA